MSKVWLMATTAALAFAAAAACDVERTGEQLTADKAMVATLLATPAVSISPAAMAGSGAGFDAGTFDGGQVTIPPQTLAFAFFVERSGATFDAPPAPVAGATMALLENGAAVAQLDEMGTGSFSSKSAQNDAIAYASGATYDFEASLEGERYVGRVAEAPNLEHVASLHPAQGYVDHPANTPFTFTRPEPPAGQPRNLGFVTVYPVDPQGQYGPPTFTNVPTTPLDFLTLVALPGQWRAAQITLPGSAFPVANQTYVLVLQAAKLGGPESENLFTGSAILAATAEVGVFRTR